MSCCAARSRGATRNNATACVIANGLELPHTANQLEMADMLTLAGEHTNHLVIHALQGQFVQYGCFGFLKHQHGAIVLLRCWPKLCWAGIMALEPVVLDFA